jgi:hypothetical protein
MKLKEVENYLMKGMKQDFNKNRFSLNEMENSYYRHIENGLQNFYIIFSKKKYEIFVEPRWSIKLNSILDIYHKVAKKEKKYFKYTSVLENNLGELIEYVDKSNDVGAFKNTQYLIENEDDLSKLLIVIPMQFDKYVLPYFNQNSTIERVDALLNAHPKDLSVHNWLYPLRACIAIIAAKLVNNPNYFELVAIYRQELTDAVPMFKTEFENLVLLLS